jgi:hypothetical protein
MNWEPEVEELHRRLELARRLGGSENVDRQHCRRPRSGATRCEARSDQRKRGN